MKQIPNIRTLHNILICRGEGSLGDAIISSCCYRGIKQANPHIKISVACYGAGYAFLKRNCYIDTIIKLPVKTRIRPHQRWASLLWAGLQLRKEHFDLVLDSSDKDFYNWRLFKWLAGGDRVLDCFTSPVKPFGSPGAHGSTHEQTILKLLGISNPDKTYDLPTTPTEQEEVSSFLAKHHLQHFIVLNPSGSVVQRRFNATTLRALYQRLLALNCPIVVPCAPDMYTYWQPIFKDMPHVFLKPTQSVFELFEWVRRCQLVITPDTSAVHIAAGFNKPTLVFYNTLSVYNAPDNPLAHIIETDPQDVNVFDWKPVDSALRLLAQNILNTQHSTDQTVAHTNII